MRFKEWRQINLNGKILLNILMFSLFASSVFCQIPTLNPDQTVNTATGEMGFSLPLGTVQGINGINFPININYSAGISAKQEASSAGLGFAIGAGSIYRKVIYVPDDNNGGSASFFMNGSDPEDACVEPWWYILYQVVLFVVGIILSIIAVYFPAVGIPAALVFSIASSISSAVIFKPADFIAGGAHLRAYKPFGSSANSLNGKGFFKEGCEHRDIPDIYFVNTPFISGELVWCGDYNLKKSGYFVFKNTNGSSGKETRTIKVEYSVNDEKFKITLADGTRLYFEETQKSNNCLKSYWQTYADARHNVECEVDNEQKQIQRVPDQWLLTKVLSPDYYGDTVALTPESDKGSWITFEYDKRIVDNCRPLPTTVQAAFDVSSSCTPGSDPVARNTSTFEEVNLINIKTPNQNAQCFYTAKRLDNLWFEVDSMDWFTPQRGQNPPEKRVKCRTGVGKPYINGSVLDSILIYSADNDTLRRIRFNTDYSLKPGSFHSYTKDVSGNFDTVPGNPKAACLTLRSLEIIDQQKTKVSKTDFGYINSDEKAWDPNQIGTLNGPDVMRYYVERKDYWGNFRLNTSNTNMFNKYGVPLQNPFAASFWSLNKIEFSTGMKINWEYDFNRYDAANNLPVTGDNGSLVKCGGGIRVHTMTIDDGTGKSMKRSYFYTDQVGCFNENVTNSSGHATAEPYPYLETADQRQNKARGGYYTACKVTYEMVQVVDNYQFLGNPAPNGYTVYEYITPKDNSDSETFINEGYYGEIDNSWKRGFLKSKRSYDKSSILIVDEKQEYEFVEQNKMDNSVLDLLDSTDSYLYEHRFGWVKAKSKTVSANNITNRTHSKYAADLSGTPVNENITRRELKLFDAGDSLEYPLFSMAFFNGRSTICRTKKLKGTSDTSKYDYILGATQEQNFYYCAGRDLSEDPTGGNRGGKWSQWGAINLDFSFPCNNRVIGMELMDVDTSNEDDLIVVIYENLYGISQDYLKVLVFHDVEFDTVGSSLRWIGDPTCTRVRLRDQDFTYLNSLNHDPEPDGCIIKNLHGTSLPDILVITNDIQLDHFPGDLKKYGNDPPIGKRFVAFIDFQEKRGTSPYSSWPEILTMYKDTTPYYFLGNNGFFSTKDSIGSNNDLVVGGPGRVSRGGSETFDMTRFVSYQVFNNIEFHDSDQTISFSSACSNCGPVPGEPNEETSLFNALPASDSSWFATRCTGFYEDGSRIRYIFYGLSRGIQCFQIADVVPVNYQCDYDGVPNRTFTKNSDGTIMLSASTPAFYNYGAMANKHILNQQCGSIEYRFPAGTPVTDLTGNLSSHADKVVGSKATTWNQVNNVYLPLANYAWNVNMNSSGLPVTNYTPFSYASNSTNTNWTMIDSISGFNKLSQIRESKKPLSDTTRLFSTIIYGHNNRLPIGSVSNAQFKECGVLTCEYNDNVGNYIDRENAWETGNGYDPGIPQSTYSVTLNKSTKHFGNASIKVVNAYGPSRNFRLNKNRDYIMSAWINVISDTAFMAGDFRYIEKASDTIWPVNGLTQDFNINFPGAKQGPTGGKWVLMKMRIPAASSLVSKDWADTNWYARMFVGAVLGGEVYIDDIRFYPVKSMVSSAYYDSLWQQTILTVDANNNPGQMATYDGLARQIRWSKIDPSQSFGVGTTLIQQKKYFIQNDGLIIKLPVKGDVFAVGHPMKITWTNEKNRKVKVSVLDITDTSYTRWTLLQTIDPLPNTKEYSYTWPSIPVSLPDGDNYRIKVEDFNDSVIFDKSGDISIRKAMIIYPVAGTVFETGTAEEIRYFIYGSDTIQVTISVNDSVIGIESNTGAFIWHVPAGFIPSDNVIIRIAGGGFTAQSKPFTVRKRGFIRRTVFDLLNRIW